MNARREVIKALKSDNLETILVAYQHDSAGVLRALQMHVYGLVDDIIRWRAISMLGNLASRYAKEEDEVYRNIIRRFILQMCEESANVPWASPEVIGAIIAGAPKNQYAEFIGPMFYHSGLNEICFAGLFWSIGQLTPAYDKRLAEFMPQTIDRLALHDIDVRAYGAWAFGKYREPAALPYLNKMLDDTRNFPIFENGVLKDYGIDDLATIAIKNINGD